MSLRYAEEIVNGPTILSGPVITGKVYGHFEKHNFAPEKFPHNVPDKLSDPAFTGSFEKQAPGSLKLIRLRESVFSLWSAGKQALGFEGSTDSEFAEF